MNGGSPRGDPRSGVARPMPATSAATLPPGAMSGETLQRKVTIVNPQGFHMRPQSQFAQLAQRYQCEVMLSLGGNRVNGKSQWDLMMLAAEPGAVLLLEVSGPDAADALEALARVLEAPAPEDDLPLPKKG